ncbi:hypothetical protein QFZ66_001230 [Streptomyces sp. B4I13]|nr:hypothetical protein [Streptomyces sp. B4I13]
MRGLGGTQLREIGGEHPPRLETVVVEIDVHLTVHGVGRRADPLNALLYRVRSGCQWDLLPHDLPPRLLVMTYFIDPQVLVALGHHLGQEGAFGARQDTGLADQVEGALDAAVVGVEAEEEVDARGFDRERPGGTGVAELGG